MSGLFSVWSWRELKPPFSTAFEHPENIEKIIKNPFKYRHYRRFDELK